MTPLVPALLALAAVFAERASRTIARAEARGWIMPAAPVAAPIRRIDLPTLVVPIAVGGAGFVLAGLLGAVVGIGAAIAAKRMRGYRNRRSTAARRDEQLADAIGAITAAVRAGMSVPQAIAYAAREAEPPIADELAHLVGDLDVGVPLSEAIAAWADRMDSEDARLIAGALDLHRRSGGDLPSVLDEVANTIRERVAVSREVRALTAQARLSGWILGILPIGFFAFLWLTSRHDIEGALRAPAGLIAVGLGLLLEGAAFLWIRSLLEVG
ncbi:MAG TPA: type II secretion system F family protein [Actinomycetota bacterium]|nr:type II secretion system F family protein [Actinomycetota bacterium]